MSRTLQYRLRNLFAATTAVAVLLGLWRLLDSRSGMAVALGVELAIPFVWRPRLLFAWFLPLVWTTIASCNYYYPGDEYGGFYVGSMAGLWIAIIADIAGAIATPQQGAVLVVTAGATTVAIAGWLLDKLRAPFIAWSVVFSIVATSLFAWSFGSFPSVERALAKNGSYEAYILPAMNLGLTFATLVTLVGAGGYRLMRCFRTRQGLTNNTASVIVIFAVALSSMSATGRASADEPDRPNVVLILADDLGYGDLACYGHPKFKTPNLDRMAAEGARLTQFNTPMPFCAPTRASLLTGRYPFRCGMNGNPAPDGGPAADDLALPKGEVTLAELFQKAGYATGMVGKWHLGHKRAEQMPTGRGFDEYLGILYSNDMRPVELVEGSKPIEYPLVQTTLTRRYTARALDFIERNQKKPFFFYFAHAMPHKPLAPAERFYKQSGSGLYGDVLMDLDASVGEVLAKLAELDLDEKTLVIFVSDNGPWFGGSSGGLRGMKGSSYEGGYRVPCIARWPKKIPAGHVNPSPAVMMDLFSTALKATGIAPPDDRVIDGRDIMPLLTGDAPSPHAAIFGQQGARLATVRDARWKLHVLPPRDNFAGLDRRDRPWVDSRAPDGVTLLAPYEQYEPRAYPGLLTGNAPQPMQLFDLQNDPGEQADVAGEHLEVVARLKALYDAMNEVAARARSEP